MRLSQKFSSDDKFVQYMAVLVALVAFGIALFSYF